MRMGVGEPTRHPMSIYIVLGLSHASHPPPSNLHPPPSRTHISMCTGECNVLRCAWDGCLRMSCVPREGEERRTLQAQGEARLEVLLAARQMRKICAAFLLAVVAIGYQYARTPLLRSGDEAWREIVGKVTRVSDGAPDELRADGREHESPQRAYSSAARGHQ